ncbi:nicotinamide riboside transporter PnuC [Ferruginibacter sp. HRS2-29]|uniref:nicotinamide riboside transporter PnuC n=1 Tax=Ferruginibacter sp. HRS2-29 TaxID=2487334 RepID=UPI0020CCAFB9|nr:nicotinamide riboside transporter PnuC [Ferruginibacter sp. HRS2-29]MCP9752953.1 nicotinamide riboside transporter PnuC [Ferruginibacter sp. HRS2-29]
MQNLIQQFLSDLAHTRWFEYLAVFSGIISVWYSRKENILVYPTGLVNTIIYIYISIKGHLLGEATVNLYYTIMSIIGWSMWAKRNNRQEIVLHITYSSRKQWLQQLGFFAVFYLAIFFSLTYFKKNFFEGVIPWADAFASATAFTGMWLMTRKKVESWYWWIATNIASIPLYFVKHYVFTSVYYLVLLIMAVAGLIEWKKRAKQTIHGA